MAYTQISDIFDPEILADQLSAKFPDELTFANSNLVDVDGTFPLGAPGTKFTMPFWKKLSGFSAMTEGTALTPGKLTSGVEHATVQRAGVAFEILNTAQLVSKADPVAEVSGQLARLAAEYLDNSIIGEAVKTPNTVDVSAVGGGLVDQNSILKASLTLGDNRAKLLQGGMVIMHSKVIGDLLQTGAIQNQYQSGMETLKTGMIQMISGMPIWVSDRVPVDTSGANPIYTTLLVAPGSLALFYQRAAMVEFDRDIYLQADAVVATVHFASHLNGYDDLTHAVVAEQAKSIRVVTLKSK